MNLEDIKHVMRSTLQKDPNAIGQLELLRKVIKAEMNGGRYYDAVAVNEADLILRHLNRTQRGMLLKIVEQIIDEVNNG